MINKVDFKGKTALVTGSTGAIGSALVERLAEEGVNLILVGSEKGRLVKLADDLELGRVIVEIITCDLSSSQELEYLVEHKLRYQPVDILINAAGVFPNKPINEMSMHEYLRVININLNAPYLICAALSPFMVKAGWGRIVNIGSSSCYAGVRNTTAYCASKHGLLGLSRALHDEISEHGVRVYSISPSSTQGPMGKSTIGQDYSTFLDPEEVADYVMFAISLDGNAMSEEILIKRMVVR